MLAVGAGLVRAPMARAVLVEAAMATATDQFPIQAVALVVSGMVAITSVLRALSSSDTRWPHNG